MKSILVILGLIGLLNRPAWAASRSSANYTLLSDATVAAGGLVSSRFYSSDAAISGPCGTGTGHPVLIIHTGPVPQRPDVVGLAVSLPSTNVNEGSLAQLAATARYDDGTYADVTRTGARWSASSPLSVSPADGLVNVGRVYENTSGTAQASYIDYTKVVALPVMNTNNDDFGSYAGDTLNDAWQVQYFGFNSPNAGPNGDPDRDGQNNAHEFTTGTSPTDASSRFQLGIAKVPGQPTWRDIVFSPALSNRNYRVEHRAALNNSWGILTGQPTTNNGDVRTVTDRTATNAVRFYRVRVTPR